MARQTNRAAIAKCSLVIVALILSLVGTSPDTPVAAAPLDPRSITISDNHAGAVNVTYNVAFGISTAGTLGSIRIQFCANSPLMDDPCIAPLGFDDSSVVIAAQNGQAGFSISPSSTANELILTRPPAGSVTGLVNYVLNNISNPAGGNSLFARILTYPTSSATGSSVDEGGLAIDIDAELSINAEVPPYLIFCVGESITNFDCNSATEPFSDLGNLTPIVTGAAQSQLVVATNASNGYTTWAAGNTMTSGNNVINPLSTLPATSQPGTSQFGMNLRANASPVVGQNPQGPGAGTVSNNFNQPNKFFFQSGAPLATSNTTEDSHKYTVSYIVNVPTTQPGGVYSTTLTYICLANF